MSETKAAGPGPHGHANPLYQGAYQRGCRCADCLAARLAYQRLYRRRRLARDPSFRAGRNESARQSRRRSNRAAAAVATPGMDHLRPSLAVGNSGYVQGCRCDGCVAAHRLINRRDRAAAKVKGVTA